MFSIALLNLGNVSIPRTSSSFQQLIEGQYSHRPKVVECMHKILTSWHSTAISSPKFCENWPENSQRSWEIKVTQIPWMGPAILFLSKYSLNLESNEASGSFRCKFWRFFNLQKQAKINHLWQIVSRQVSQFRREDKLGYNYEETRKITCLRNIFTNLKKLRPLPRYNVAKLGPTHNFWDNCVDKYRRKSCFGTWKIFQLFARTPKYGQGV